jgi:hypothetical protein
MDTPRLTEEASLCKSRERYRTSTTPHMYGVLGWTDVCKTASTPAWNRHLPLGSDLSVLTSKRVGNSKK